MMPHALREALAAFRRTPALTGLSAIMIALSLFVVGLFGLTAHNIHQVLQQVESRVEVVAYLHDDAASPSIDELQAEVGGYEEVDAVRYVSREEALDIARRELEEFRIIFSDLSVNPLPASLEIRLRPGYRNPSAVRSVVERVDAYDFVEDVRFGSEWLDKVFLLRRIAGAASLVLGAAFAAVAVLIIVSAVRMAIFARRDEIAIMRLVGATRGFVRRPFLLEGLLTGLLGGLLALPALYAVFRLLSGAVVELEWLPEAWLIGGVIGGALVGTIGSGVAVRKHLRSR
ncbi:MAG: cell division protein FtsX [Gemmatimonadota bacterium]